jgi:hypothetical protein
MPVFYCKRRAATNPSANRDYVFVGKLLRGYDLNRVLQNATEMSAAAVMLNITNRRATTLLVRDIGPTKPAQPADHLPCETMSNPGLEWPDPSTTSCGRRPAATIPTSLRNISWSASNDS